MKASDTFLRCFQKFGNSAPIDDTIVVFGQRVYLSNVEQYILENEKLIVAFLKTKNKEDLEKTQTKMAFMKGL